MSIKAKLILIIVIAVVVVAVVVLLIMFKGGGNAEPQDVDPPEVIEEIEEIAGEEPGLDKPEQEDEDQGSGDVVYDYNDLSTAIAGIPNAAALDAIYILLEGFWITEDNPFVGFIFEDGGHAVDFGLLQTSYGYGGLITDGRGTGKYEAELIITVPALPATEMDDARPESQEKIYIDIEGLYEPDNSIRVKTEKLDSGNWNTYIYGGYTLDQAIENWQN